VLISFAAAPKEPFAMPIYEYACPKCGEFEITQRITEEPLKKCPTCKSKVRKLISNTSFQLKGSGWYATDYAKKSSGKESGAKDAGAKDSATAKSDAGSTESKPAEGSGTKSDSPGTKKNSTAKAA
jgi:putative FmdB family regulatory protein